MKFYWVFVIAAVGCFIFLAFRNGVGTDESVLRIEVRRTGENQTATFINGRRKAPGTLVAAIKARLTRVPDYVDDLGTHPDIEVRINGDPDTEFGAFRPALEACRECGIHLVTFDSGERDAPVFLFNPYDLRRAWNGTPAVCFHPPRIKLLWIEKGSRKETNSPDGRPLLKIKRMVLETNTSEGKPSPDYKKLGRYLSNALKYFQHPWKSYPFLTAEIDALWNVAFGVVVHCAWVAEDSGILECCLANLPWKYDFRNEWDWDWDRARAEGETYKKQVARIRRKRKEGRE